MPRILTVPVRLTEGVPLVQLSGLIAVDAARRWASDPDEPVEVRVATLAGGVGVHHELERVLAREGLDRATVGPEAFADRVAAFEAEARARMATVATLLGADADLTSGPTDSPEACAAAVTAFVRLYDAGIVRRDERVVPTCPRCATAVSVADLVVEREPVDVLVLRAGDAGTTVELRLTDPELLPGAVAVAVPPGHPLEGGELDLPLAGRVPVVGDATVDGPAAVVPAHDGASFALARRVNLPVPVVVDDDGVVVADGPLAGFARYAARAAAVELVGDAGHVEVDEDHRVRRCGACRTPVVDRLARLWFADLTGSAGAAADALREGVVTFAPPTARDEFLQAAGDDGEWCISLQLATGCALPVAICLDCGLPSVGVDVADTCGKCLGVLEPEPGVLDPRFVGAVAVLAAAGWPGDEGGPAREAPATTLVCGPGGVARWVVPTFALAEALTGSLPVAAVVVHEPASDDPMQTVDVDALTAAGSVAAVRLAVLSGDLDVARAEDVVDRLLHPPAGTADVAELTDAVEAAFAGANVGTVVGLLSAAAEAGVPPEDAERFRRLVAPLLATR